MITGVHTQNSIPYIGFKSSEPKPLNSHPFLAFEPLMNVPLDTAKAYFSPTLTQGYREIADYKTPYAKECKMFELSNGHKVLIFQKKGSMIINTGVKTDPKINQELKHLTEHILYNDNSIADNQTFCDFQKSLAITMNAETAPHLTRYAMRYSLNNTKDIEKIIKAQSELLFNRDLKPFFEIEKNTITIETLTKKQSLEDLKKVTLDELQKYYENTYKSNNMATVISSELPVNDVIKIFEKYFGKHDQKFTASNLNKDMQSEQSAFEKYKSNVRKNEKIKTIENYIQNQLLNLNYTDALVEFSLDDILTRGRPCILSYFNNFKNNGETTTDSDFKEYSSVLFDTSKTKEYVYPNNMHLTFDTAEGYNDQSRLTYLLKTDMPLNTKPGTCEILGCMLALADEEKSLIEFGTLNAVAGNNYIKIDAFYHPKDTIQCINKQNQCLLQPNLSAKNFETAKTLTQHRFMTNKESRNTTRDKLMHKEEYLYAGCVPLYTPLKEGLELYDNITLEDVKQLYSYILTNAKASAIFVGANNYTENNKKQLLEEIGKGLPVFKPYNGTMLTTKSNARIAMPDKTQVIKNVEDTQTAYVGLNFKIPLQNNAKDYIGLKMLETIIGGEGYSRLLTQLRSRDNLVYQASSNLIEQQYLTFSDLALEVYVPVLGDKHENLQKACNCFTENINDIKANGVKEEELNTAKKTLKSYFADSNTNPMKRHLKISTYSVQDLKNIEKIIDSVTSADIQAIANKYLNNGIWDIKASEKTFEYNSEYLNNLEK